LRFLFVAVVSDRAEEEEEIGVAKGDVPPLVDTFQAVSDDDVSLPPAAEGAFETVMEDVSLVDESCEKGAESVQSLTSTASGTTTSTKKNSSNGAKHPLKRLWKKATKKSSPAAIETVDPLASALSSTQSTEAEHSESLRFTSPQLMSSQQREDEMQLTLAEELTDE
jgi:hypothetical protein